MDRGFSRQKVFKSALCIVPPLELWDPIQAIRAVHDRGFVRWPPHVNLLYPFVPHVDPDLELELVSPEKKKLEDDREARKERSVFVGNIPLHSTSDDLKTLFVDYKDDLLDVSLPLDPRSKRPRGFGFLEFTSPEVAKTLVDRVSSGHNFSLDGRNLNIQPALEKENRSAPLSNEFPLARDVLQSALDDAFPQLRAFDIVFDEMQFFVHSKRSATLWLRPHAEWSSDVDEELNVVSDGSDPIQVLYSVLTKTLPFCDDQHSEHGGSYTPHLSLGQFSGEKAARRAMETFSSTFPFGLRFRVTALDLIARRDFDDPFSTKLRVTLPCGPVAREDKRIDVDLNDMALGVANLSL